MSLILIKPKEVEYSNSQFIDILKAIKKYPDGVSLTFPSGKSGLRSIKWNCDSNEDSLYKAATLLTNQLRYLKESNNDTLVGKEFVIYLRRTVDKSTTTGVGSICPMGLGESYSQRFITTETINDVPFLYFSGVIDYTKIKNKQAVSNIYNTDSDIFKYIKSLPKEVIKGFAANPVAFIEYLKNSELTGRITKSLILENIEGDLQMYYIKNDFIELNNSQLLVTKADFLNENVLEWATEINSSTSAYTAPKKESNNAVTTNNYNSAYIIPTTNEGFNMKLKVLELGNKTEIEKSNTNVVKKETTQTEEDDDSPSPIGFKIKSSNSRTATDKFFIKKFGVNYNIYDIISSDESTLEDMIFEVIEVGAPLVDEIGKTFKIATLTSDHVNTKGEKYPVILLVDNYKVRTTVDKVRNQLSKYSKVIFDEYEINKYRSYYLLRQMHNANLLTNNTLKELSNKFNEQVRLLRSNKSTKGYITFNKLNKLQKLGNEFNSLSNKANRVLTIDGINLYFKVYPLKGVNLEEFNDIFIEKETGEASYIETYRKRERTELVS